MKMKLFAAQDIESEQGEGYVEHTFIVANSEKEAFNMFIEEFNNTWCGTYLYMWLGEVVPNEELNDEDIGYWIGKGKGVWEA